jgi:hypothetical protein
VRRGYAPATAQLLGSQATAEAHDKSVVVVSDPDCLHQTLAKGRLYEDETQLGVSVAVFVCEPPCEKAVFGSVMSAFEVAFPPLWHAAKEVTDPNTINPTVRTTSFRMRNDSRTNCGCKQIFSEAIEPAIGNPSPLFFGFTEANGAQEREPRDDARRGSETFDFSVH